MVKGENSIQELNTIIKNSFSGIKRDMDELKQTQLLNIGTLKQLRDEIEGFKKDFVTVDKLNAIKIKIGDIKEDIKGLQRLEKDTKKLTENSIDKNTYQKNNQRSDQKITELKDQISVVEKISKDAIPENTFKRLTKEVNDELIAMRKDISLMEKEGGTIVRNELKKFIEKTEKDNAKVHEKFEITAQNITSQMDRISSALNDKINKVNVDINKKLQNLHSTMKKNVTEQQVKGLVKDINSEFDNVKEGFNDLKELKSDLKKLSKRTVTKDYLENYIDKRIKGVEKETGIVEVKRADKKAKKKVKAERKAEKKAKRKAEKSAEKGSTGRRYDAFTISTALIVLSFIALGASIITFFTDLGSLMDYLLVAAIAMFMIGIGIRLFLVIREG